MARNSGLHENLARDEDVEVGSERSFGLVFAVVFAIIGLWPLTGAFGDEGAGPLRLWALGIAAVFVVLAFAAPKALKPLNLIWFKFGMLLHKIVNPLVMGLLFFVTVTPIALIMRIRGKDLLSMKFDPEADSYWIERDPPGPAPETMSKQF